MFSHISLQQSWAQTLAIQLLGRMFSLVDTIIIFLMFVFYTHGYCGLESVHGAKHAAFL